MSAVPSREELSGNSVKLKLVGAKTYTSHPLGVGITSPVEAGDVISVPTEYAEYLLRDTWREGKHGVYPVWSADLEAPVKLKAVDPAPIEAQRAIEEDRRKLEAALEVSEARARAAEERERAILDRIAALEATHAEKAVQKPSKAPSRKRATTKAASPQE